MPHPLLVALFDDAAPAAVAARALRELGIEGEHLSIVSRTHEEEGALARQTGGTPGADIEDSRAAARLGELGAQIIAAIALVMPGIGPIVAAGPLAAELGETAGHAAGGVASILQRAGVSPERAAALQDRVGKGGVLLGVHIYGDSLEESRTILERHGAREIELAEWS